MKRSLNVLVVEDDPWFAEQHIRVLRSAGFEASHAPDGIAAIAALDSTLLDLVVLDLFLPGPNALTLLHEMQSYTDLSALPVIVCSGSAADIPPGKLAPYGVVDVLDKNVMQPSDLVRAARRALA